MAESPINLRALALRLVVAVVSHVAVVNLNQVVIVLHRA